MGVLSHPQYEELFAAPGNKAIPASTYLRVLMHVREGLVPFIANFMNFFCYPLDIVYSSPPPSSSAAHIYGDVQGALSTYPRQCGQSQLYRRKHYIPVKHKPLYVPNLSKLRVFCSMLCTVNQEIFTVKIFSAVA